MARKIKKLKWVDIKFLLRLKDFKTYYEFFNKNNKTADGRNYLAINSYMFYTYGTLLSNATLKCSGRDTTKTASNEIMAAWWGMFYPKRKSAYIVPSEKHYGEFFANLETLFTTNEFLKLFLKSWDKRYKFFTFHNNHLLEARVMGYEAEGERQLIALHFDFLVIDEAQEISYLALTNLLPGGKINCPMIVSGVPNDIRTSVLWWAYSNEKIDYYRFASYEGPNWSELKRDYLLDVCAMKLGEEKDTNKWTAAWRTQVEGVWGDPAKAVFPPSQIQQAKKDIPMYWNDIIHARPGVEFRKAIAPPVRPAGAKSVWIAADIGPLQAPTVITVWANYDERDKLVSECIYRLYAKGFGITIAAEIIAFLTDWFSAERIGADVHGAGQNIAELLKNKTYFGDKAVHYENIFIPFDSANKIEVGFNMEKDKNGNPALDKNGKKVYKAVVDSVKVYSTTLLQKYFAEGLIKIPEKDYQFIEALQAEIAIVNRARIGGFTYQNLKDEHTIDSMRCFAFIRFKTTEDPAKPPDTQIRQPFLLPKITRIRK